MDGTGREPHTGKELLHRRPNLHHLVSSHTSRREHQHETYTSFIFVLCPSRYMTPLLGPPWSATYLATRLA